MSYLKKINRISSPTSFSKEEVSKLIEANSGLQRSLFFPEQAFHRLVKQYIEQMRAPSVEAAEVVHHRMMELHSKVVLPELDRFPKVKSMLSKEIADIARQTTDDCVSFVNQIIDIQSAYINTEHQVFKEKNSPIISRNYDD